MSQRPWVGGGFQDARYLICPPDGSTADHWAFPSGSGSAVMSPIGVELSRKGLPNYRLGRTLTSPRSVTACQVLARSWVEASNSSHSPDTPRRRTEPSGAITVWVPVARSLTVRVTTTRCSPASSSARESDVNAIPADLLIEELDLSRVDRGADPESRTGECLDEPERTPERTRRGVEGCRDPVAVGLEESPAEPLQLGMGRPAVPTEQLTPAPVHHRGGATGGIHGIGEEDGREDAIRVLRRLQRLDLLVSPGVRLGVLARGSLTCRLVADEDDPRHGYPRIEESQMRGIGLVPKETLPAPRTGYTMSRYSSMRSCFVSEFTRSALP